MVIVKLTDEFHHRDCIAQDLGEHLVDGLEQMTAEELKEEGEVYCATCGEQINPDEVTLEESEPTDVTPELDLPGLDLNEE